MGNKKDIMKKIDEIEKQETKLPKNEKVPCPFRPCKKSFNTEKEADEHAMTHSACAKTFYFLKYNYKSFQSE